MNKKIIMIVMAVLALASCNTSKKFVYFQDMYEDNLYPISKRPEIIVRQNDRLNIVVSCKSPELAMPFNVTAGLLQVNSDGTVSESSGNSSAKISGYLVDGDGQIDFPILGKIKVGGLTVAQVSDAIRDAIIAGGYINDPLVKVDFVNFHYTVLGASGPSVRSSENEKVTILDAIANGGDIPVNGRVDNVMVIRELNGSRVVYKMDLRTKDIFDSPGYYLQQNDIVYVEPKYKGQEPFFKAVSYVSSGFSFISTISSLVILAISLGIITL